MLKNPKVLLWLLVIPGVYAFILLFQSFVFRVYINQSPSIEEGFYRSISKARISKGDIVAYELSGLAAKVISDYELTYNQLLFKPVIATSGDTACWISGSVSVNGVLVLQQPIPNILSIPVYPDGCLDLHDNQIVLGTPNNRNSVDSRYFGPVNSSSVKDVIAKL